jgi:diguanylate cyclase (GGDEF)-like protein
MKQLQFAFKEENTLNDELKRIRQWVRSDLCSVILIQIYTEILNKVRIERVCAQIKEQLPEALIVGCSSNGNIMNGDFSGGTFVVSCSLFEYPSTRIEVFQYKLTPETQRQVIDSLRQEVEKRPWVKGIETLVTIRGMSMTALCDGLSSLPEGIQVFGGGAFSPDIDQNDACVFSSAGGYQERSIVFALFGGEDLHLKTGYMTGWKPLGLYMDVTATDGHLLKELNHRPAYETYYKYLHIRNDENFFFNTLEFPFLYREHDIDIMRAPTASNPDGSLTMTADITEGVKTRIAYGDPWTILNAARQEGNVLLTFAPEAITVFSCAARRTFWGNAEVGKETEPYQIVAPTSGFYTSGEFLRTNGFVNQHNVTQVIAAMREGDPKANPEQEIVMSTHSFEGKVSMINRMATFIKATAEELAEANSKLAEANSKLAEANRQLSELAVTDALTRIGNKTAYFEKVREMDAEIAANRASFTVAVFDLNGLKNINDNYGHECGDEAIADAAKVLIDVFDRDRLYRIGGDEFIAVLKGENDIFGLFDELDRAITEANKREKAYKTPLSMSKGYALFDQERDREYRDVAHRADDAMYEDKAEYYKKHDRRRH